MSERTLLVDADGNRFLFDAVFSAAHSVSVSVTNHPVQSGASVSDHAWVEPETVTLSVGVSDAMTDASALTDESRSVAAFRKLREMALARRPLTLVTRLCVYSNMLVESVSCEESADTMSALRAEITLKRVSMAQVSEMSVQQTASSSKIAYETGLQSDAGAGYAGETFGGSQAAYSVAQNPQIEAMLIAMLERGEL